ncbi:lactonase family protein [Paenibacillus wynnii]|uniref:3-carboxymuconate cyclase n=1 Tax=Paenibacillus wynnii TaxID=268407 RepID=A0A098M2T7_9BACL|nr:lactonase family protein [Paenibacillus wynnii]KGE16754.1 3-carboxymuconate cyclase [Paenibacillus wynnii]
MNKHAKMLLFTGSYSDAADNGIQVFEFNVEAGGTLSLLHKVKGLTNPTFVEVDPVGLRLYAIGEKPNGEGGKEGEVAAYAIHPETGELSELSRSATMPAGGKGQTTTCHISRDVESQYLVVCSYHGGSVGLLSLDDEGKTRRVCDIAVHTGHGTDPVRQDRPHPHSAIFSPDGRFIFVPDLGLDVIRCYSIDRLNGTWVFQGDIALHPGAGPRHFTFHPDGRSAYVINEVDSTITSFTFEPESGLLNTIMTVSTLPEGFIGDNICAEITLSIDGRFVYGSNRGMDSIVVYGVDAATAKLTFIEHVSTRGGHPRHFTVTPDGGYLIVANRDADNLVVFSLDRDTGRLTFTGNTAEVSKPVCVKPALFNL